MPNVGLKKRRASIYPRIEKCCLDCMSQRPCPALLVIAMRNAFEEAAPSGRGKMSTISAPPTLPETTEIRPQSPAGVSGPRNYLNAELGIKSWLLTQDHKRIAILYLIPAVGKEGNLQPLERSRT
jgi:hypothetical protein